MTVEERVANGVKWLDRQVPHWEDRVTVNGLQMSNPCRCVLGYVFRQDAKYYEQDSGYGYAKDYLVSAVDPVRWGEDHGFEARGDSLTTIPKDFQELNREWKRVIRERQSMNVSV